ncbi:DUF726 domain-containing protein [Plectosphaerella plurivora]|uniref:DUF726 domain-containing protein n=1 Tax=Plectosphaerella plurivora TaxID=936078 RepID=A0A9P8V558_9PEZI|nr:DUF726 domain-containing protein [Plectosphaerella plurivora]
MAGSRGGKKPPFPRSNRTTDITGVLSVEEKVALGNLVAEIAARMDGRIVSRFDNVRVPITTENPQHSLLVPFLKPTDDSNKENHPPSSSQRNRVPTGPRTSKPSGRAPLATRGNQTGATAVNTTTQKPQGGPAAQEMKKELLVVYQKWQSNLISRVKDLSVKEPPAVSASAVRGGRGGRGRGRGGRGDYGAAEDARKTIPPARAGARGVTGATYSRATGSSGVAEDVDHELARRYPSLPTPLSALPLDRRKLCLHLMLLTVISMDAYSSFSRIFMLYFTSSLHLPLQAIQEDEVRLGRGLGKAAEDLDLGFVAQQKTTESKKSRKWKAAGASLIATQGAGLAEPFVWAGMGCIPGSTQTGISHATVAKILGNVAHNGIIVGNIVGIYAGRETGTMIDQYAKDSTDFAFLSLNADSSESYRDSSNVAAEKRRMRFVLGIGGWLTYKDGSADPFKCLRSPSAESFALRYEVYNLMALGTSLEQIIFRSNMWTAISKEMAYCDVYSCLLNNKWPLGMLRLSKVIDNPWNVGMTRCEKAGMALAECIGRKIQGDRPVSLVGYSLGARVIYTCLMALAERRQFGLIENVVLIGAPIPADPRLWLSMKSVVHGRLVNVWSENDWLLGFLFRTANLEYGVAGLQPVSGMDGVENYNASALIKGHLRYQYTMGKILKSIGWEDVDQAQVVEDEATLAKKDKKIRRKRTPAAPHLPVDKQLKAVHRPISKDSKPSGSSISGLEARMTKMTIQG